MRVRETKGLREIEHSRTTAVLSRAAAADDMLRTPSGALRSMLDSHTSAMPTLPSRKKEKKTPKAKPRASPARE